ncbi:MAG TPA: EAL domain-containing protein [Solirubrobacterales bacterium]|jgi:diguanylate cyclase (GGDEF)-like protein|nr:EAL domain-containing protein [Solirubrobacterales bacterium]
MSQGNTTVRGTMPPVAPPEQPAPGGRQLGEALKARSDEVAARIRAHVEVPGHEVEPIVRENLTRISAPSTEAVARWIAGERMDVAIEAGRGTWEIFGELAVHRAASLQEVTWRCFWWRNVVAEVLREAAVELGVSDEALSEALNKLQLGLEVSLLRMCESFEEERQRTDEELARRDAELAFLATHDPLTGLPNRTLILDRTEQTLARARRSGRPAAALFIDLDNFKDINDTLGHSAGDDLLQAVAARLRGVTREGDALGRLGGDEFVVVCEVDDLDAWPELLAERLLEALRPPFRIGTERRNQVSVRASIGIALDDRVSADELLRNADIAMYQAKWGGKNRIALFEAGMQEKMQTRVELEMDLREALAKDEFFLVYQPAIELDELRPTRLEALIRWRHPERGVMSPLTFIPLLEETGQIAEVGSWVLAQACLQGAAWWAAGHQVTIAVNVSPRQLENDQIIADIKAALAASELPPSALMLEVTETALMRCPDENARRLSAVKEMGVQIAIDDFGTGYSSLAHLQKLPVDVLKIDRSFVSGLHENPEGETLVQTLVQLGKALSIETCAEGIEEECELEVLRSTECDSGQGFLFATPLEPGEVDAFLGSFSLDSGRRERAWQPETAVPSGAEISKAAAVPSP